MAVTFLTNEDEKKFLKTVNGTTPDENGNVEIEAGGGGVQSETIENIWSGTQAEYDAITEKATLLYT